jgi:outer membrane protein assembly factor BamA
LNARNLIILLTIIVVVPLSLSFSDVRGSGRILTLQYDPRAGVTTTAVVGSAPSLPENRLAASSDGTFDMEAWREEIGSRLAPYYGSIVDTIVVEGNTRTRCVTIVREMATKEGLPLVENLIQRDTSYLRGLGYFSEVDIRAECAESGGCRITVTVAERPDLFMKYPYPVVNYDFTEGVSYGFRWRIKNFRGYGEHLSISALKRRDRDHGGGISWAVPWVGGRRLRSSAQLYTSRRLDEPESDDFIKERHGTRLGVGIPLTKSLVNQVWMSPVLSFERRESRLSRGDNVGAAAGYYRQNLFSAGLEVRYDSRDNVLAAFKGLLSRFSVVRYTAVHGLRQQYTFYHVTNHVYIPLGRLGSLILAIDGDFRDGDLPSFFEMDLGGNNSLRGYDRSGKGKVKLLQTVQLRRQIFGPRVFDIPYIGKFDITVNAVAFLDNGALSNSISDFGGSRFHTTGGFGFEILSPIQDIVRLEFAVDEWGDPTLNIISGTRFN